MEASDLIFQKVPKIQSHHFGFQERKQPLKMHGSRSVLEKIKTSYQNSLANTHRAESKTSQQQPFANFRQSGQVNQSIHLQKISDRNAQLTKIYQPLQPQFTQLPSIKTGGQGSVIAPVTAPYMHKRNKLINNVSLASLRPPRAPDSSPIRPL
mmetsp:Transcript_9061/g.15308  ORF Transcript_9061/g.15308 Transcript_9061/m.15308 type:complete len:153 (+) Transcript_9061:1091-1549(+)